MATIAVPQRRPLVSRFYISMAAVFVAIAFGGFFATYWLQLARGTFTGGAMLHLHGLLFSLWTLFFLSQAMLVGTTALLQAAVARFFFLAVTGGGPGMRPGLGPPLPVEATVVPGLLVNLLIVA
ncbi:MAG TPA: hypothetical protein VE403_01665, partial [Sphingomicrobium sp.]|nr:hypothetical protein [Sphingomicrobium sp.]